ncbi:MAG: hypothetical protein KAQ93_03565 [Spirochaetales bacterium]|nr:hypothetical protein [Spirochaetales bacterium]
MKKLILLIAILMIISSITAFADTSEFYVKTLPIVKVYDHTLGYRIVYMKSNFELTAIYIPKEWFRTAAETGEPPKAELVAGKDSAYPYFSVFWKGADFDHIRIYVHIDLNNPTWGDLDPLVDITEKFNVETLKLKL